MPPPPVCARCRAPPPPSSSLSEHAYALPAMSNVREAEPSAARRALARRLATGERAPRTSAAAVASSRHPPSPRTTARTVTSSSPSCASRAASCSAGVAGVDTRVAQECARDDDGDGGVCTAALCAPTTGDVLPLHVGAACTPVVAAAAAAAAVVVCHAVHCCTSVCAAAKISRDIICSTPRNEDGSARMAPTSSAPPSGVCAWGGAHACALRICCAT